MVNSLKQEVTVGDQKVFIPNKITIKRPHESSNFAEKIRMAPAHFLLNSPSTSVDPVIDPKRRYPCNQCDKGFSRSDHLRRHQITHLPRDQRPHKCSICYQFFTLVEDLKIHMGTHPPDPSRPFPCETCGKCFGTKTHLNQHMAYHKSPEERELNSKKNKKKEVVQNIPEMEESSDNKSENEDEVVESVIPSPNYLKTGSTKVQKYQCHECTISFTTQALLEAHKNIHDPLSDARTYKCQLCDKVFGKAQNLRKHQLVHSQDYNYECDECFKKFKEKKR